MRVTFYNNYSDNKTINKQITPLTTIDCNIKEPCNITNPVIRISRKSFTNWINANYVYISTYQRFYYITNVTVITGDMLEISLKVDVLKSFSAQIRAITCVIQRQENLTNPYIIDNKIPIRSHRVIAFKEIGNLGNDNTIILTVNGGNIETTETETGGIEV